MAEYLKVTGTVGPMNPNGPDKVSFTVVQHVEQEGGRVSQEQVGHFIVPAGSEPRVHAEVEVVVRDAKKGG